MARPTKYSDIKARAICASLRNGATRTAAVGSVCVSYDAFLRWLKRFPDFAQSVTKAEAECEVEMCRVIWDAAQAGDWRAALWWLERRRPADWGR